MAELRNKHMEASQAGRTDEANKLAVILSQHVAAYKKGREFMVKMMEAKRAAEAAQGSSQPVHDPAAPTAGTTQHSTPTISALPTPNTNTRSTSRLSTPLMAPNPNPMNPSPSHVSTNSGVGSGSVANANAALLQAFNPAATQVQTQTGLGPDDHSLGTMQQQHGLPHNNTLGQQQPMPAGFAAQMKKLVEQRGLAQNGQTLISAGNSAGINGGAGTPVTPAMAAAGFGETRDVRWVGTFVWQGTDPARNEKKEVRAQVVATAPSGNPCAVSLILTSYKGTYINYRMATTWPTVLSLSPAGPAVQMNELQEWMKRTQPVLMRVQAAPGTDDHNFGQLVKLLRERSYVSRGHVVGVSHIPPLTLFMRSVRSYGMGDPRHGPHHDEPSHRAIFAGPARCCVPRLWYARTAQASRAAAGLLRAPGDLQLATATVSQSSRATAQPHHHADISSPATTCSGASRRTSLDAAATATTSATAASTATAAADPTTTTRPLPSKPQRQRLNVRESGTQARRTQPIRTRKSSERHCEWIADPAIRDVARTAATATATTATAAATATATTTATTTSAAESAARSAGDAPCAQWRPRCRRRRWPRRRADEHGRKCWWWWWRARGLGLTSPWRRARVWQ